MEDKNTTPQPDTKAKKIKLNFSDSKYAKSFSTFRETMCQM